MVAYTVSLIILTLIMEKVNVVAIPKWLKYIVFGVL